MRATTEIHIDIEVGDPRYEVESEFQLSPTDRDSDSILRPATERVQEPRNELVARLKEAIEHFDYSMILRIVDEVTSNAAFVLGSRFQGRR